MRTSRRIGWHIAAFVVATAGCAAAWAANARDDGECLMVRLSAGQPALSVVQRLEGRKLNIRVRDAGGTTLGEACFPTRYGRAKARRIAVLAAGTEQLAVEFEGNTGSGVLQTLLAIVRLDQGVFKTVLLETVDYRVDGPGVHQRLQVALAPARAGASAAQLKLAFTQHSPRERRWTDSLRWSDATGSFYDPAVEQARARSAVTPVRRNIAQARLAVLAMGQAGLCDVDLNALTSLYEILWQERP